jgi:hypothetical protein
LGWGSRLLVRRKVFVSYHHRGDQAFYDAFSDAFHERYEAITDNSLERRIDSADVAYVMRRIREHHLSGSSCTVVLCGAQTPQRKYVDWEIEASLDQEMGLVTILLPTIHRFANGGTDKPPRLQENIDSGYSPWAMWTDVIGTPGKLGALIEDANSRSRRLIANSRARMVRNG